MLRLTYPAWSRRLRLAHIVAALFLVALLRPAAAQSAPLPADPVEAFRQVLVQDRSPNPPPEALEARRKNLEAAARSLRTLGDLSRALLLLEWSSGGLGGAEADVDRLVRQSIVDRFEQGIKDVIAHGSAVDKIAVAYLLSFTVAGARRQDTQGAEAGGSGRKTSSASFRFLRQRLRTLVPDLDRLAQDPSPDVRAAAANALANIEGDPRQTVPVLQGLLKSSNVIVRRAAAEALATMVQVAIQLNNDTQGFFEPLELPDDKIASDVEMTRARYRSEPLRSSIVVVPAACGALGDSDSDVRRKAISACRKASAALVNLMPAVPTEMPPQTRKLSAEEVARVMTERAKVNAMMEGINPLLDAYRNQSGALTRAAADEDTVVRVEVRKVLEDLAQVAQKIQRVREGFAYPEVPDKMPEKDTEKKGESGSGGPARAQALSGIAEPGLSPSTVEAFSPLPPGQPAPPEEATLEAPVKLSPTEARATAGRMVSARPTAFVRQPGEDLPPPKRAATDAATATLAKTMDAVIAGLADPKPQVRLASIYVLETMGDTAAPGLPALVKALRDSNLFVRWAAARTLGRLAPAGAEKAVPELATLMSPQEDLSVRLMVADTLGKYGPAARGAVPALGAAVTRSDVELRVGILKALEAIGNDAAPAIPAIAWGLKDESSQVRAESARVLGHFGRSAARALPALRKALNDSVEDVRRAASEAILSIDRR
jgi:HEAT repeat protein